MGKTKRNASRWMESRFKLGDPRYPEDNTQFFDGRYQNKMRNGNVSYHSMVIDPVSYKVISWRDYGNWAKPLAKRAARHNAKLMVMQLTKEILIELMMDLEDQLIENEDWYDDHPMGFDYGYCDEAREYAETRRQEELAGGYGYDFYISYLMNVEDEENETDQQEYDDYDDYSDWEGY